ncbi:transcriptional regulator [Agrobacterium salinitolerans]|uniref:HVO_A0114 family putative DNA-binding protein n=1 Tax=Agrobacterium salinitolerans TaxID=1183413 RepID=UPI003F57E402
MRFLKGQRTRCVQVTPQSPRQSSPFRRPHSFFCHHPQKVELIEHHQKIGPSSIRGLARSVERDVKRAHEDASALSDWGIFEQTKDGKVHVPYDVIHANFDLRAAA